ncbi:hypothetical protein KJ909_00385 [Patescibacteria group bacterium]|nr:hypothetical protein [Patescibacteria group bacterium]
MSRLLIVDGHAIAHRAYHSIPPFSHNGQPVNLIYGFYSMLLSVIDQLQPKYLLVCLDSPGPVFRNQEFLAYRTQRKPADKNLVVQLPELKNSLEKAAIPNFSLGGYEADDLIATLTHQSLIKPLISRVTIITGDKDLMQLVNSRVELFMPVRGLSQTQTFHPKDVFQKLGVKPSQVVDFKALMGDSSDNYPGVAGIGPKSAIDLLSTFGSLDNIYKNIKKIKPTLKTKLVENKDNAYLSQKLAQLVYDAPVKLNLKKTLWGQDRIKSLQQLFLSYNFRSLVSRLQKKYPEFHPPNQTSLF